MSSNMNGKTFTLILVAGAIFYVAARFAYASALELETSPAPHDRCLAEASRVWTPETLSVAEPERGSSAADAKWFLAGCRVGMGFSR